MSLGFMVAMSVSCSGETENQSPHSKPQSLLEKKLSRSVMTPGSELLPEDEVLQRDATYKQTLMPSIPEKTWIQNEITSVLNFIGTSEMQFEELPDLMLDTVKADVLYKVAVKSLSYSKPEDQSVSLSYTMIEKGDILVTTTYNPFTSVIEGTESFHHAYLCVEDPTSDTSLSLITTLGQEDPYVNLYPVQWVKDHDSKVAVLRLHNRDKSDINTITDFARSRIGSFYNVEFVDKTLTDRFYCSQLVWRAYLEGGVNIDYNDQEADDYGMVLVSDIYKSPYLYVVHFAE